MFTLETTRKAGGLQILRCQGIEVNYYNFTLDALTLKPSGFCNVRVKSGREALKNYRKIAAMADNKNTQYSPFNEACQNILYEHPEAIGVAYKVLNCGCAVICGATVAGDPLGTLHHISGQPVKGEGRSPICLKCRKDKGLDRVVWEGIYWPGPQSEWPDKDLRISIGRMIFGTGYMEPE